MMNNVILCGMNNCGKTTFANKIYEKYGFEIKHFDGNFDSTLNNLLEYAQLKHRVYDRFHIGELVYSKIYGRVPRLNDLEKNKITNEILENNGCILFFVCSDFSILRNNYFMKNEEYDEEFVSKEYNYFIKEYNEIKDKKNVILVDIANGFPELSLLKKDVNDFYLITLRKLLNEGNKVKTNNSRSDEVVELENYTETIEDLSNEYVSFGDFTNLNYLGGELAWYASGSNKLDYISRFSKFWSKVSDDGITCNSSYGDIIFNRHGYNQLEQVIELLSKDNNSRRGIINFNVPNPNRISTKDDTCTICLQFCIRNNELHQSIIMRSQDIRFGMLYDIPFFIIIGKIIAERLGIELNKVNYTALSLHMYKRDSKFLISNYVNSKETKNKPHLFEFFKDVLNKKINVDDLDNTNILTKIF